jgi:alpha-beta hydrolase superfamily lysophospholipase
MAKATISNLPNPIKFPSFYEDQLLLSDRHWPVEKPKAALLFIHGFGDYSVRTTFIQEFFSQHNIAVFDYDWRGHGRSQGERGYIPHVRAAFRDIDAAIDQLKKKYPSLPIVVYGDGIGAAMIIFYVERQPNNLPFHGLIVCSPSVCLPKARPGPIQMAIVRAFANLAPAVRMPVRGEQYSVLATDDQAVLDAFSKDKLVHDRWPARTLDIMLETAIELERAHIVFLVPILIQYGTRSIMKKKFLQNWVNRSSSTKTKEFKVWEDLHQSLHNDTKRNDVFQYTLEWIEKNVIGQP